MPEPARRIRLDKWLWHARFAKSRSIASGLISAGHVRVNANKALKPAQAVGPGDVLTFPQGNRIRVVKLLGIGARRGPAPEAQALYEDLTPPSDPPSPAPKYDNAHRDGGRPTKRDRRKIDAERARELD